MEKTPFGNRNNCFRQESLVNAKMRVMLKHEEETGYLHGLKKSPQEIFTSHKKKR